MERQKLFDIPNVESMSQKVLCVALKRWFKKNGTIAFEHGYKAYIVSDKKKWRLTIARDSGIDMVGATPDTRKHWCYQPYSGLPKQSLLRIMRICEDYYNYCLTEA